MARLGGEGLYIFGSTLYHEDLRWKVNVGMDQPQFVAYFRTLFPKSEYPPDFQTFPAYGAGVILEEMIKKTGTLDAKDLKQAALNLSAR